MIGQVATVEGRPEQLDELVRILREETFPVLRERHGFVDAIILVDRTSGRSVLITLWEGAEAFRDSERAWRREGASVGVAEELGLRRRAHLFDVAVSARTS